MNEIIMATTNKPVFTNRLLQGATNRIMKIGETVRKCAFETAYIMAKVDETECYKDDGFNNVHQWAMKTFGFKKSVSYSLLRIGKEYTRAIADTNGRAKGFTSNLLPEESDVDFTTSQIEKMLPAGHDMAAQLVNDAIITPAMSCKEIEKVIKAKTKDEDETAETTETSETTEAAETTETPVEVADYSVDVYDEDGVVYRVPHDILVQYRI